MKWRTNKAVVVNNTDKVNVTLHYLNLDHNAPFDYRNNRFEIYRIAGESALLTRIFDTRDTKAWNYPTIKAAKSAVERWLKLESESHALVLRSTSAIESTIDSTIESIKVSPVSSGQLAKVEANRYAMCYGSTVEILRYDRHYDLVHVKYTTGSMVNRTAQVKPQVLKPIN